MKKYPVFIALSFVCFSFIFMNCEKDPKETTPWDMNRKYLLVDMQTSIPVDINFDGIENTDLRMEADAFQDCYIYISGETITIAWPEAQVGEYPVSTSEVPTVYTGQDIKYFIVPKYYIYSEIFWGSTCAWIYLIEIKDGRQWNYFEYTPPQILIIDPKENTISFMLNNCWQNFITKDGIMSPSFSAVFKPDPKDGYSR